MQKTASNTDSTHWPQVALLYAAGMLAAFQYAKLAYILPGLQAQTAMGPMQEALALSVIGLVGALLGACAGALCQALGLRRTLLGGLLLGMLGAALPLLASDYALLLAGRLLESAAHMAIVVTVPTIMLGLCAAHDRARVMALWSCYFTLTFILSAGLMPPLVLAGGWQAVALMHAAALLLVGLLCGVYLRPAAAPASDGNAGHRTHAASLSTEGVASAVDNGSTHAPTKVSTNTSINTSIHTSTNPSIHSPTDTSPRTPQPGLAAPYTASSALPLRQLLQAQLRLLSEPRLLVVPATFFGYTLLFVALVNVLPKLLANGALSATTLALLLPIASLVGTVVALFTLGRGIAGHRLVRWSATALLLAALALMALPAHHSATQAVVLLAFVGLGTLPAGIISSLPALLGPADPQLPLVNGGIVQFGNLGNFVGSPILAALLVQLGWTGVGIYLLAGALIVSLSLVFLRRGVLRAAQQPANTSP